MNTLFRLASKNYSSEEHGGLSVQGLLHMNTFNEEQDSSCFVFGPDKVEMKNVNSDWKALFFFLLYYGKAIEHLEAHDVSARLIIKAMKGVFEKPFDLTELPKLKPEIALTYFKMNKECKKFCKAGLRKKKRIIDFVHMFIKNDKEKGKFIDQLRDLSLSETATMHNLIARAAINQLVLKNSISSGNGTKLARFIENKVSKIPELRGEKAIEDNLLKLTTSSDVTKITLCHVINNDKEGPTAVVDMINKSPNLLEKMKQSLPGNSHFYLVVNGPYNYSLFEEEEFIDSVKKMYEKNKALLTPYMIEADENQFENFRKAFVSITKGFYDQNIKYIELMEPNAFPYCKVPQIAHKKYMEVITLWGIVHKFLYDKYNKKTKRAVDLTANDLTELKAALDGWIEANKNQIVRPSGHLRSVFDKSVVSQGFQCHSLKAYHNIDTWVLTSIEYLMSNGKLNKKKSLRKMHKIL